MDMPARRTQQNALIAPRTSSLAMDCTTTIPPQAPVTAGSSRESDERISQAAIEKKMAASAIEVLGGGQSVLEKMTQFMDAASALSAICGDAELHCFITCKGNPTHAPISAEQLLPLKSTLFHSALHESHRGCTVAAQALRDAFLIARRVSEGRFYFDASLSQPAQPHTHAGNKPQLVLPIWFPYRVSCTPEPSNGSQPVYILCRNNVMMALSRIPVLKLAEVYSNFFNAVWTMGAEQGRVNGRRTYAQMTPPWLRDNTIFIHGENRNLSIPFTQRVLPTKNTIRQRSSKILGCAILDTWLRKEEPCRPFLQFLIRDAGISIPNNSAPANSDPDEGTTIQNHAVSLSRPVIGDGSI